MKTICLSTIAVTLFLLTIDVPAAISASRENPQNCYEVAATWVQTLQSKKENVLLSHTRNKCNYAQTWVHKLGKEPQANRERICKDLVLIYTHKECVYFRDYVDPAAYNPCKGWTREMYGKCMEEDERWFSE